MKIKLLVLTLVLFNCCVLAKTDQAGIAKNKVDKCGTVHHTENLKLQNPNLEQLIISDELKLQKIIKSYSNSRMSNTVYTIPVVVHIVYFSNAQNISDAQVHSQIDVLNEDFARVNLDTSDTPNIFLPFASATNFQFCLARIDPNGAPTNGIERRQTNIEVFQPDDNVKFFSRGGLDAWDVTKYLNIWVCDMGGQIIGYGEQPTSMQTNTFGVVIQYNTFGRTGVVVPPYQYGRTCTHEISHCFDLYHIWGDEDACTGTDFIDDTPNQSEATFGCHSFPYADACTVTYPGIMFMNYMDYSDDACMNMFTHDQSARMLTAVNTYYPSLLSSNVCLLDAIEELQNFQFKLYPNPSSGLFEIDLSGSKYAGSITSISITDIYGKIVYESKYNNSNELIHKIDLQEFSNGIYFISVFNTKIKKTEKIVLNR